MKWQKERDFQLYLVDILQQVFGENRVGIEYTVSKKQEGYGIVDIVIFPDYFPKGKNEYNKGFLIEVKKRNSYQYPPSLSKQFKYQRERYEKISGQVCLLIFPNNVKSLIEAIRNKKALSDLRNLF